MGNAHNIKIIPQLHALVLAGLSADDLIALHNFLEPLIQQFDTASCNFGRPFTLPAGGTGSGGPIEDTQIGEVISSIGAWAHQQDQRVLERLAMVGTNASPDEHDWLSAILLADAARLGDWDHTRKVFERLAGVARSIHTARAK